MSEREPYVDPSGQLTFGERVYRSFPWPIMDKLLHTKGVGHPTAMVESIEGSTGIPAFDDEEFGELMRDMNDMADRATQKLQELDAKRRRQR